MAEMWTAMVPPFEMENRGNATVGQIAMDNTCALQNKHVVAVAGEWIAFRQSLIDQHGQIERLGDLAGHIEGRVLERPQRRLHPVENELTGRFAVMCMRMAIVDQSHPFGGERTQCRQPPGQVSLSTGGI